MGKGFIRRRWHRILLLLLFSLLIWNFVFEEQGLVDYIRLRREEHILKEKIIELKGREALLLHKKDFLSTPEGLKTVLVLRLGYTDIK